jgi:hypothetical protein
MAWHNEFDNDRWYGNRWNRDVWGVGGYSNPDNGGYGAGSHGGWSPGGWGGGNYYGAGNFGSRWGPGYYGDVYGGFGAPRYGAGYSGYGGFGGYGAGNYGASGYGGYGGYGAPMRGYYGQNNYGRGSYAQGYYGQNNFGYGEGFGQGNFAGRGPRNYQRSDDRIREDMNDQLTSHPGLDASDIQVQVKNGELTLSGSVDSRWAKREAEDIADSILGVKDVHNQLSVSRLQSEREVSRQPARETRSGGATTEGRSRGKGAGTSART